MISEDKKQLVKRALDVAVADGFVAGANVLAIVDGVESLYLQAGWADRETASPIARNSLFRLFSMTKPITATAVMILMERGVIDLYEPVSTFLPAFRTQTVDTSGGNVPAAREMTIKDLLSMTSGLVYGGENRAGRETLALFQEIGERLSGANPMGTVEVADRLGQCTLAFHPGTSWQYGSSADVLGAVVEVASGKRFGTFLSEEIFTPLGMIDTAFMVPEGKRGRLAKVYGADESGSLVPYTGVHLGISNGMDRIPAFESGGAGLVSSIDDYARFAMMLMSGGCMDTARILSPRTVDYMTSSTLNASQQAGFDSWLTLAGHSYGNLMRVMTDSTLAGDLGFTGEYGWDGWLGAYFCNCPKQRLTIVAMMQRTGAGTNQLTRKLRNIIMSAF